MVDKKLRTQLADVLDWKSAHVRFDDAVGGIPQRLRGAVPPGLPHSAWQIVEHMRIAQHDILDFCRNPEYAEKKWPGDYWPAQAEPANDAAWKTSIAAFRRDRKAMQRLAADPNVDLTGQIPHGDGQTYLREVLLVADHNAYHVGQLVDVRRALGIWQ
jgi:uncharacterized damage-inducible protein DinB